MERSGTQLQQKHRLRRRRLEEALKEGKNEIAEWVFASDAGTPLDMHNVERRELQKSLQAAKLRKIRLHDLRYVSSLIMF